MNTRTARRARNIALVALVIVAWGFAVETAIIGALLQGQGESQSSIRVLLLLSVGSLLISVLACGRAVMLLRSQGHDTSSLPPTIATGRRPERPREKLLAG